ncbi:alpha/beta hydrolase [Macrococcoides caseolyticum]|uniref:alpha/beta hydrolase n=1 Tax=Macrococcoides caseolyticum TaxID=69966 RepID=UPI001F286C9F|nr:dienelactone hydrolase family protein [Macrococcus caseolyticus]MCE4956598.1 dienelactone hydrolase family protein [Macrococcus caseolyticus]
MNYFYQKNDANELVVLFHGTGGNEYQLLGLAGELFPGADVLSFEGDSGGAMSRRFFPPLINGEMDRNAYNDAIRRVTEVINGLDLNYEKITFLGYSNGANFIVGFLENGFDMDAAVLMHPSDLKYDVTNAKRDTKVYITAGANDYMVPPGQAKALELQFKSAFDNVNFMLFDGGHEITQKELDELKRVL